MDSCYWLNNKRDGISAGWFFSGKPRYQYFYRNDMLIKNGKTWFENGRVEEALMLDDNGNGTMVVYHENGVQATGGKISLGKKEGNWTYTDKNKIVSQKITYEKDSVMVTVNFDEKGKETKTNILANREVDFQGGLEGWRKYLEKKFRYPKKSMKEHVQGVAYVSLRVDEKGKTTDVRLLSAPDEYTGEEAVRVIQAAPDWIPAIRNNRYVSVSFVQTVTFLLQ